MEIVVYEKEKTLNPFTRGSDRKTERLDVSLSGATEASALAEDGKARRDREGTDSVT